MFMFYLLSCLWFYAHAAEPNSNEENNKLKEVLMSDLRYLEELQSHIRSLRRVVDDFSEHLGKMKESGKDIAADVESYVYNPIKRIYFMERYADDWSVVGEYLNTTSEIQQTFKDKLNEVLNVLPDGNKAPEPGWIDEILSTFERQSQPFCFNPPKTIHTVFGTSHHSSF